MKGIILGTVMFVLVIACVARGAMYIMVNRTQGAGASPTPTPTTTPGQCFGAACATTLQPPALVNQVTYLPGSHTYNGTAFTVHGDGVTDDSASLQAALQQGDVLVEPPSVYYYIAPKGGGQASIIVPAGRNIRCDTNNNAAGGTVAFAAVPNPPSTSTNYITFDWFNASGGSIFWCQFRGKGYNSAGQPPLDNVSNIEQPIVVQGSSSGQIIAQNDFNGISGGVGAININGTGQQNPFPTGVTIEYNTFEHCGLQDALINGGTNITVTHNTSFDCTNGVEATLYTASYSNIQETNNLWQFEFGDGYCQSGGGTPGAGCTYITTGNACHDASQGGNPACAFCCVAPTTQNYSSVTFQNNEIQWIQPGSHASLPGVGFNEGNQQSTVSNGCFNPNNGIVLPAVINNNLCQGTSSAVLCQQGTSSVSVFCPPGSPGSNQ